MGFIVWLIIGGVVGWLASLIMRTDAQQGVLMNIVVGIVGAFIAGLILPRIGLPLIGGAIVGSIIYATIGAVILLAIISLIRRA